MVDNNGDLGSRMRMLIYMGVGNVVRIDCGSSLVFRDMPQIK